MEARDLMVNHAKSVGRKELHPYTVGAINGALKCGFTSDETVVLIGEIIETMHEVMDDKSIPWDVDAECPEDTEKAPVDAGTEGEEITQVNYIVNEEVVANE